MKSKNGLYAVCEIKSSKSYYAKLLTFDDEVTIKSLFDDPHVVEVRIYRSYEEAKEWLEEIYNVSHDDEGHIIRSREFN